MGNCASAMDGLIPWGWGAKNAAAPNNPAGMYTRISASPPTTDSLLHSSSPLFLLSPFV
jgi:hypothetical protein